MENLSPHTGTRLYLRVFRKIYIIMFIFNGLYHFVD